MSLNSWRGEGQHCCFRHPTLKPLKSLNQRWRTGWVACRSLGTGILVPGIVQNECTLNPHPLFPAISLQPLLLLSCATHQNRHLPATLGSARITRRSHTLAIKALTPCPEALQYCPRCWSVWGFSHGQAHVFTSWYLLLLRPITLPGLCPLTLSLCVTEYHLINQTHVVSYRGKGLSTANCHPSITLISHQILNVS